MLPTAPPAAPSSFGAALLRLARSAITGAVAGEPTPPLDVSDPRLGDRQGCFVSLHATGRLRGCIGSIEPTGPLLETVPDLAVAAATRDPRFPPVTAAELGGLVIEVSVLSAPRLLPIRGAADAASRLAPGIDGVVLRRGGHSATFLPQVWEQLPRPERFLAELLRKAGLSPTAWDEEIELETYRVERWSESG